MPRASQFIVDADWLEERLGKPGLSIVDASWYLPAQGRDARAEYEAAHIPGAVFFDHDDVVDPDSDLPHTLPPPEDLCPHAGSMGISADDTIVVYDGPGLFSAPRVWWMFRIMGVNQVFLLDGGFDRWKAEGRPVTAEPTKIAPNVFHADFDASQRRRRSTDDARIVETGSAPDRRCAARRPLRRPRPGAAARRARRPHAGRAAACLPRRLSRDGKLLPPEELRSSDREGGHRPATDRSSPPAAPASPRRSLRWRWKRLATRTTGSMTAHGPNGAAQRHAGRDRQGLSMAMNDSARTDRGHGDLSRDGGAAAHYSAAAGATARSRCCRRATCRCISTAT